MFHLTYEALLRHHHLSPEERAANHRQSMRHLHAFLVVRDGRTRGNMKAYSAWSGISLRRLNKFYAAFRKALSLNYDRLSVQYGHYGSN